MEFLKEFILMYFSVGIITTLCYSQFDRFQAFICFFTWPVLIYIEVEYIMYSVLKALEDYIFAIVDDIFRMMKK